MSSTSNIQNLLVNVFRPTISYDGSLGYVPKLNICNVDTISAKSLSVTTFGLGDSNGNIFIGSNAGGTSSNTANTVVGVSAGSGMANSTSCVYIGNIAGIGAQGASNVIGIGKEARGAGTSNIYIGSDTGSSNASSSNNILIGHGLDFSGQIVTNTLQIGRPGSLVIQGDLANKQVGINTFPSYGLDVCGSFSFHDSNGNFTYALDASSNTQIDFRSSNVGKKAILNVVGDVYGQTFFGDLSGSLSSSSVKMGNGSITNPSYSFSNDASTGFFYSGTPATLGITTRSCNSMFITTTGVGIGTSNPSTALDVSGTTRSSNYTTVAVTSSNNIGGIVLSNYRIAGGNPANSTISAVVDMGGGYNDSGAANTRSVPALSFQYGDITTGGYRHFVRSRHNAGPGSSGNAIDFYTNESATATTSTAPGTGNKLVMSVTGAGVGIGTLTPTFNLDVSGNIRSTSTTTSNSIGGVVLSNSNVLTGNGSVSAPSHTFTSDASLGLYRVGANQLGFTSAGVNRMVISNSNVGIGTTAPQYTIDVSMTTDPGLVLRHSTLPATIRLLGGGVADGASAGMQLYHTSNQQGILSSNTNPFHIWTTGIQRLTISGERVGIGTTVPTERLDVCGNIRSVNNSNNVMGLFATSYGSYLHIGAWNPAGSLSSNIVLNQNGGNIGIGTSNPVTKLEVNSTTQIGWSNRTSSNASNYQISIRDSNAGGLFLGNFYTGGIGTGSTIQSSDTVSNVLSNAPLFLNPRGGNVGIATSSPSYNLDVSGTIRGTSNLLFSTNGAVGSPLIATTGFSNTGFYFASDAQPAVCQGSQEITRWSGTGMYVSVSGTTTTPSIGWLAAGAASIGFSKPTNTKISFITGSTERMTISGGNVGIGLTAPSFPLDVNGTIRGSSNIVAVATTSNWVGAATAVSDTSLTIVYTPKQSGTVKLLVNANATMYTRSGSGFDGAVLQIRNNSTVITDYYLNFSGETVYGRSGNSYSGGRWGTVSVSGTSLINMRVTQAGDDGVDVRDGYLSVFELSST